MFQVTEKALEMINELLKDREEAHTIRFVMTEGGCAGPSLGMALDDQKEDDEMFKENGITFVISKERDYRVIDPIRFAAKLGVHPLVHQAVHAAAHVVVHKIGK